MEVFFHPESDALACVRPGKSIQSLDNHEFCLIQHIVAHDFQKCRHALVLDDRVKMKVFSFDQSLKT